MTSKWDISRGAKKYNSCAAAEHVCFLPIFTNLTRLHYFLFKVILKQNPHIAVANFTSRDDSCEEPEPYCSHGFSCKTSLFSKPWLGWEGLGCWYSCLGDRFSSILATKLQREISVSQWSMGAYHIHIKYKNLYSQKEYQILKSCSEEQKESHILSEKQTSEK